MRRLARLVPLALLLAAAPARGQEDPARAYPVPTAGQRVLLVVGALGGGALTVGLVGPFAPLTIGAATYGTSAALGLRPTVGGVAFDTAVGTAAGIATYAATVFYVTEVEGYPHEFGVDVLGLVAGLAVAGVTTGAVHGERLSRLRASRDAAAGPTVLVAPTGERAPGVALHVPF